MKHLHHRTLIAIILVVSLLAFSLFIILFVTGQKAAQKLDQKEIPEVMEQIAENNSVEWMAGIWAEVVNYPLDTETSTATTDIYQYDGGIVEMEVTFQNGLDLAQPYYLMVLVDGLPTEFRVGTDTFSKYNITLTKNQESLDIAFTPSFSLNLGRIDFFLCYDENPQADFFATCHTIWMNQSEKIVVPKDQLPTIAQRAGIDGKFIDGAYGAWIWNESAVLSNETFIGPKLIHIDDLEPLLFEAVASDPGMYRTTLYVDGELLSFSIDSSTDTVFFIDWESKGIDMLQVPIIIRDKLAKSGSFFTVSVPLSKDATLPAFISPRIEVKINDTR